MKRRNSTYCIALLMLCLINIGCKKYLDVTTDKKLVVITNLTDLQSLLDMYTYVNYRDISAGEESADNYFLPYSTWSSLEEFERNLYIWKPDNIFPLYSAYGANAWSDTYDIIYRSNTVLDNMDKVVRTSSNQIEWDNIKGQALFLRAKSFLQAAWTWSLAYDNISSSSDLGLPLRLDPDFNEVSIRSTVQQTYDQVVQDFKESLLLLPNNPIHVVRPCKAAAYGYLARTYLSMRSYDKALLYADSCLQLRSALLDYNNLSASSSFPVPRFNQEVVYESKISISNSLFSGRIDSTLYQSYSTNDLRRTIYFRISGATGLTIYKGSYEQGSDLFSAIATDEMYLIRAECYARAGNKVAALQDLNTLMITRWKNNGTWAAFTATDATDALNKILVERRKELVYRGLRWPDIKRLNKEGANISLKRILNGQTYLLPPNDLRYALAIPEDVISRSGMPQNPR